jgi:hypothetical protein
MFQIHLKEMHPWSRGKNCNRYICLKTRPNVYIPFMNVILLKYFICEAFSTQVMEL